MNDGPATPVFRFAPSPNGRLHLGHAYSALMNARAAAEVGGRLLLRIEDTDATRCKREYEEAILDDLAWLGLNFPEPRRRQSEHIDDYSRAINLLEARGLAYPCFCKRGDIARAAGNLRDPDGAPLHKGRCRTLLAEEIAAREAAGDVPALRLNAERALSLPGSKLSWREYHEGADETLVAADPAVWGDIVLRGKAGPASYHLAVVVDDALQGVSDVVRGRDLFAATSIHRLLQHLLGLQAPRYRHHRLVLDASAKKMSKSAASTPLAELRRQGVTPAQIRATLGFGGVADDRLRVTLS